MFKHRNLIHASMYMNFIEAGEVDQTSILAAGLGYVLSLVVLLFLHCYGSGRRSVDRDRHPSWRQGPLRHTGCQLLIVVLRPAHLEPPVMTALCAVVVLLLHLLTSELSWSWPGIGNFE